MNILDRSKTDIAWLAGLFEGEGSLNRIRHSGVRLTIHMTDEDVIRHVREVAGGAMYGPRDRGKYKPMYIWQLTKWSDVLQLLGLILPYMGQRRRAKMEEVIAEAAADGRWKGTYKPCDMNLGISNRGYLWHLNGGGMPACETCMASYRLYMARWRTDHRDKTRSYEHKARAKRNAANRLKRQTQTSTGSASPPSEMPSA